MDDSTASGVDGDGDGRCGHIGKSNMQQAIVSPDACIAGLVLANLLDACRTQNVQQSAIGVNLAIAVFVVRIAEAFFRVATGALQYAYDVVARQVRVGL